MTDTSGSRIRILLAGIDCRRSGELASAFAARGCSATLVAEPRDAERWLEESHFDLLTTSLEVLDEHRVSFAQHVRDADCAVLILGGDAVRDLDDVVHATIPADATADEAALAGSVLVQQHVKRAAEPTIRWGGFTLDLARRSASCGDLPLVLTRLELRVLRALVEAEGEVVTPSELEHAVYGHDPVDGGQRVAAHIRRLRRKVEPDPSDPTVLLTVRGEGFRLAAIEVDAT